MIFTRTTSQLNRATYFVLKKEFWIISNAYNKRSLQNHRFQIESIQKFNFFLKNSLYNRGGFRGGGGRLFLRDSTPCRPKGSPFDTFSEIHFWPTDPKVFLKAPWAPIYTNYIFSNIFSGAVNLVNTWTKKCFGRARKINLVDLKKGCQNFGKFFENPPPPSRKS